MTVSAKGFPGVQVMAMDRDGGPAFFKVAGEKEQIPVVDGSVSVYDPRGLDGVELTSSGLTFTP